VRGHTTKHLDLLHISGQWRCRAGFCLAALITLAVAAGPARAAPHKTGFEGQKLTRAGLGPIRPGMSEAEFKAAAGDLFANTNAAQNPTCFYATPAARDRHLRGLTIIIAAHKVAAIEVHGGHVQSDRGIHINSTAAAIRAAYPAKDFTVESVPFGEPAIGEGYTLSVKPRGGALQFAFFMNNSGRVTGFGVGAPDSPLMSQDGCL